MRRIVVGSVLVLAAALPAGAAAHIERSSYWPDPAVDHSVKGGAGGAVPKARSLSSAVKKQKVGRVRVVCKASSRRILNRSIKRALKNGFDIRPHDHRKLTKKQAKRLRAVNKKLKAKCRYREIQPAVNASRNNDRVVVMPGIYTEPTARKAKTFDPACDKYEILNERGSLGTSYASQFHCPNDQNLIAVMGRALGPGADPPVREDRHGIPNLGPCIRCNLQVEGSGVSADDVVIDGGRVESGNRGPIGAAKDVGIRADRADGFVLRNVTVRHVKEHAIYSLETDGYLLDRFKVFYGAEYGVLTFVNDHGLMQNCEAVGAGDSGLYPGAGAETGVQRDRRYDPVFRYSQEIRLCDSHHNLSGYSGTDGNATHVNRNNFYDNALGFTTDVFTAPGHPGFPQDSDLVEDNNIYSNNFDPYTDRSDVDPSSTLPVGTGLWIAGGNHNVVRNNRFWDNWRRGIMLFAAPDVLVCGPLIGEPVTGCDPAKVSTSFGNRFYGNIMGVAPDGGSAPNGLDFWWDSFPGNTGNCWYGNTGAPGSAVTTSPAVLPGCKNGTDPGTSVGIGNAVNQVELYACFGAITLTYNDPKTVLCPWFKKPPRPGGASASAPIRRLAEDPAVRADVCRLSRDDESAACGR
jgi:hypothetical protein